MSKVTIELDAAIVKKAVNAKVQPAVEKILSTVDLPSRIMKALMEAPKEDGRYQSAFGALMMMDYARYGSNNRVPIENFIDAEISAAAKTYIQKAIQADAPKIEEAFRRMMASSSNKLAKTLLASLENSLKDEWTFTLDTKMSAKEPPSRDYD